MPVHNRDGTGWKKAQRTPQALKKVLVEGKENNPPASSVLHTPQSVCQATCNLERVPSEEVRSAGTGSKVNRSKQKERSINALMKTPCLSDLVVPSLGQERMPFFDMMQLPRASRLLARQAQKV